MVHLHLIELKICKQLHKYKFGKHNIHLYTITKKTSNKMIENPLNTVQRTQEFWSR